MFYTYVLLCLDKNSDISFYIGSCQDLKARYNKHEAGYVKSTKRFVKLGLIYYEACLSRKDALIREKQLKTGFGRGYLKRRLKSSIKIMRE